MRNLRGPNSPQGVTLLHRGGPRTELPTLLGLEHQVSVIGSPAALATGGQSTTVVVVDVPRPIRRGVCEQVRRHYRGRLVVLLDPGDGSPDLPPDHNRTLLTRPFSIGELLAAVAGSGPRRAPSDPAGDLARPPEAWSRLRRARRVVAQVAPRLLASWRERRLVQASAILLLAALALTVAFTLVNQDAGCGAGCDELTGADLTSPPTTVTAVVAGPGPIASSTTIAGSTPTDPSVGATADAAGRVDGATGGTPALAGAPGESSGAPGATSPPAPTPPQPTAAPSTVAPTTAPTTTSPTTSAPTTIVTTTTTTAPTGP